MGFPRYPKKNLGSGGAHPLWAPRPPNKAFWGPGPHGRWAPQVPNFFWEVQEDPIGPPVKIK